MHKKLSTAEITDEVIEEFKKTYGKVTRYKTTDGKVVYFRSPDRKEVAAAQTVAKEKDGISSNQVLAKAIALGGDVEILDQDRYLFAMGEHLQKVIDKVEGELEEL